VLLTERVACVDNGCLASCDANHLKRITRKPSPFSTCLDGRGSWRCLISDLRSSIHPTSSVGVLCGRVAQGQRV
jgi:hypothetical protein